VTGPALLSPAALDFLWESLHVGELPYPFDLRSHGATTDERRALRQRAFDDLRERGVLDGAGRIAAHVEDWLTMLARPDVSIDSVYLPEPDGPSMAALAVRRGSSALVATQDDDGLLLRPIHPGGLASAIVELLPAARRGTQQSITLPAEELANLRAGRPAGPTTVDRQVLARLSAQPKLRAGQLAANAGKRMGGRIRSPVLSWFDTLSGRYLTYAKRGADGREWITIAPADAATLRHRLGVLLDPLLHSSGLTG
jgi:hypothetical protein